MRTYNRKWDGMGGVGVHRCANEPECQARLGSLGRSARLVGNLGSLGTSARLVGDLGSALTSRNFPNEPSLLALLWWGVCLQKTYCKS